MYSILCYTILHPDAGQVPGAVGLRRRQGDDAGQANA